MVLLKKVGNLRPISGKVRTFFFRDHYDFGAKSGVFCLFGPLIFSISQNGPRLKKVGHPGLNTCLGLFRVSNSMGIVQISMGYIIVYSTLLLKLP